MLRDGLSCDPKLTGDRIDAARCFVAGDQVIDFSFAKSPRRLSCRTRGRRASMLGCGRCELNGHIGLTRLFGIDVQQVHGARRPIRHEIMTDRPFPFRLDASLAGALPVA